MGVFKYGAVLVALLAIAIGSVKTVKPALFFKVPNVGFILWAITGGNMPPYFSHDAWEPEEMKTWIKDGDVVVATGAKSGTTWMLYCTHQIRTKGSDDVEYGDVSYSTPWPDMVQNPGSSWKEQKDLFNTTVLPDGKKLKDYWDNPEFPYRVWCAIMLQCISCTLIYMSFAYTRLLFLITEIAHTHPHRKSHMTPKHIHVKQFPKVKFVAMVCNIFI